MSDLGEEVEGVSLEIIRYGMGSFEKLEGEAFFKKNILSFQDNL